MIAKENLPEPVQKAKEHVDSAVAWVTGKAPPQVRNHGMAWHGM